MIIDIIDEAVATQLSGANFSLLTWRPCERVRPASLDINASQACVKCGCWVTGSSVSESCMFLPQQACISQQKVNLKTVCRWSYGHKTSIFTTVLVYVWTHTHTHTHNRWRAVSFLCILYHPLSLPRPPSFPLWLSSSYSRASGVSSLLGHINFVKQGNKSIDGTTDVGNRFVTFSQM